MLNIILVYNSTFLSHFTSCFFVAIKSRIIIPQEYTRNILFVKYFSGSSKQYNSLYRFLGIENVLFVDSRYASVESCDWPAQKNFLKYSSIMERNVCQRCPHSTLHCALLTQPFHRRSR